MAEAKHTTWWRAHLNLTNMLTVAFLGYMVMTFRTLFSIASPSIPSVIRADGTLKPVLRPLWAQAPDGLQMEVILSTSQYRGTADAMKSELLIVRERGLNFSSVDTDLDLDIQLLRASGKAEADVDSTSDVGDSLGGERGSGKVVGLRVVCNHMGSSADVSEEASKQCVKLWEQWAAMQPGGVGAAYSAAEYKPAPAGLLQTLRRLVSRVASLPTSDASERVLSGPLTIGEWRAPVAVRIARAITRGQPVFAHASLAWAGYPALSTHVMRHITPPPNVTDPTAPAGWHAYDPLRTATATARLVGDSPYEPRKPLRHLWADPFGTRTPAIVDAAGVVLDSAAGLALSKAGAGLGKAPLQPAKGRPWPHWMGQLSLYAVTALEPLPRDELPPSIAPYIRTDSARSVHLPLLTANPVRPTRDRMHPLNATLTSLPLRVSLAQSAVGKWQLLSLLDDSVTKQQAMGATEKDTDDVIRMLAETPLWLLGLTFVISFVHLLFDVLAFKADVSFWQSTPTLAGISVKSLSHQLVSNAVITAYLWSEGSSLLVLVPQAANTLLYVWKLAKASGWQVTLKWGFLPTGVVYSRSLHASTTAGKGSAADSEAVRYMSAVLAPLLAGYALYSFVNDKFAGWGEFALLTAVSAVYGSGFALMTPQLWVNYKLKSVAHMPWNVLIYRFSATFIDDLFAAIIKARMRCLQRRWWCWHVGFTTTLLTNTCPHPRRPTPPHTPSADAAHAPHQRLPGRRNLHPVPAAAPHVPRGRLAPRRGVRGRRRRRRCGSASEARAAVVSGVQRHSQRWKQQRERRPRRAGRSKRRA